MCGIAGIFYPAGNQQNDEALLKFMISRVHHRGPDGYGFYSDPDVSLAHARLSIIDIAGGKQPIHNETESVWVIFNGEIFNYIELREALIKKGHRFYTQTDTEVIVHLYEEYGTSFVSHLNGQFAIALWDKKLRTLFLTRDRTGITPLFFTQQKDKLVFASEIKSILPALDSIPDTNLRALDQLFTFWAPISPNTLFDGIEEVSPGEIITICGDKISREKYWDWLYPVDGNYSNQSEDELAEELKDLLIDATKIRLRSDVPVAAYLSGGLDSSVLVSIIKNFTNTPLRTFSIGFDEAEMDESVFQKELIEHLGAKHSRIQCSNENIAENFEKTIWHTEAPILRTAPIPMGMLSALVHQSEYKVVLTGEGSDEVLGGYDIFKEAKIRQFWAVNKDSGFRPLLLKRLYPYLDISPGKSQVYLQNFFGAGLEQPDLSYFSHIPRWVTTAKTKEFYSDSIKSSLSDTSIEDIQSTFPEQLSKWHPFNKAQYIEAKSLMAGYLLCSQGDRMLMRNSVEGRFPFLDHRVIEFAKQLHPKIKMKALNEKYLLKKSMGRYIPNSITRRHKQPYRAPDIPSFQVARGKEIISDLLSEEKIKRYDYFDPAKVSLLLRKINAGRAIGFKDNMAFMGVISTQMWHYLFKEKANTFRS